MMLKTAVSTETAVSMLDRATFLSMMSYLCEARDLVVAMIKSRYWVKINVEQDMKMVVSNLIPNLRSWAVPHRHTHPIGNGCGY